MNFEFKLPDIGEGIHEAELLGFHVKVGDLVEDGQDLATLNTDKVTVDLPSPCRGTILSLHGKPGEVLVVGSVLAVVETENRALFCTHAHQRALATLHGLPPKRAPAELSHAEPSHVPAMRGPATPRPIVAGPSTRKLARECDVDLTSVQATGPHGRILRADVEAAARRARDSAPAPEATRRLKLHGARATSARNLHDSVQRSVTTTTSFEVQADGLEVLLARLAPAAAQRNLKLSPLHLIAKCCAQVLRRHERFNATIDEATGDLLLHEQVDLGIAVAAGDRLVVPVLRRVEQSSLFGLATALSALAERARNGTLALSDLRGGTFTVSSTGGLERASVLSTRPIILPPQTAILWCSRIKARPRVVGDKLGVGPMLHCSLSFDHRYIDGAEATAFINDLAEHLEQPELGLV